MKISSKLTSWAYKLYIDDVLHMMVRHRDLIAVQSWGDRGTFCIELTLQGGTLLLEYSGETLWRQVLARIDDDILHNAERRAPSPVPESVPDAIGPAAIKLAGSAR